MDVKWLVSYGGFDQHFSDANLPSFCTIPELNTVRRADEGLSIITKIVLT